MKRKKRGHLKKMALLMFLLLVACVGYFLVVNGVIHYSSKLKSFGIIKQEEHNTASDKYGWELMLVNRDNYVPDIYEIDFMELSNGQKIDSRIYPYLQEMFDDARNAGVYPFVREGYRTAEEQQQILDDKIAAYRSEGYTKHMAEETPHLHIDFVPYITGSKRGLDTRVSLKSALAAEGFASGTRGAAELNQWIASEKQELATVMERYGVEWLQKGTHEKHLSVLEFEKKERAREVAELDSQKQEITSVVAQLGEEVSVKKQELKNATAEKELAEEATQRAKEEGAVAQQEKEVLLASNQDLRMENARLESRKDRLRMDNHDLKQKQLQLQTDNEELEQRHEDLQYTNSKLENVNDQLSADNHTLEQRNDSLKSDNQVLRQKYNDLQQNNVQLEKQQNELKSHIEQMVQSEQLLQRDVRKYDEAPEWQLPEPGAFASAKSFRDKVVMPFVNKLKTLIKNLTIQCVRLKEEVLQLRKEKKRLSDDVGFYKGKIKDMSDRTELLQEKADDLERVKRYVGAEQIDTIIRKVKEQERTEQQIRQYDRSYGTR